jgi:regulatory subunit for Cdc7p protein kinase
MAALSLPVPRDPIPSPSTMSTRRTPLSSNPNAANSPLRGGSALQAKIKRSYAHVQREEPYGQPPPLKKQILDSGAQRAVRSPSTVAQRSRGVISATSQRQSGKSRTATTAVTQTSVEASARHIHERDFLNWQKQHRAKFPSFVFFFDRVSDDVRKGLLKHIVYLGAVSLPTSRLFSCRMSCRLTR